LLTNPTGDNSSLTAPYKFFTIHRAIAVWAAIAFPTAIVEVIDIAWFTGLVLGFGLASAVL
jgi:hypothetical protein